MFSWFKKKFDKENLKKTKDEVGIFLTDDKKNTLYLSDKDENLKIIMYDESANKITMTITNGQINVLSQILNLKAKGTSIQMISKKIKE